MDDNGDQVVPESHDLDRTSGPPDRETPSSPDRILSAVNDDHRRAILNSLIDAPGQRLAFETLVDRVTDRVGDDRPAGGSDDRRQRVRIALHHTHLPKLEAVRMIDYTEASHVQFVGGKPERDLLTLVGSYGADE